MPEKNTSLSAGLLWRRFSMVLPSAGSFTSFCHKTSAQAIFRDACGKRKREDPPGRKDGIAEGFLRGKRRKKSRRHAQKTPRNFIWIINQ
jgi:hypothetical protein